MKHYNILLLGSGGRESAFAWKLLQSPRCGELFIAPGNGGTQQFGTNVAISPTDFPAIKTFCIEHRIDLVLPGGEDALVAGIFDFFKNDEELKGIIVAGPSSQGALLEGSKSFAKRFMHRHGIPTASYREFDDHSFDEGIAYIRQLSPPIVLKADGLAGGKGVVIAQSVSEAATVFTNMIRQEQFGAAGKKVVIEQFLSGVELSMFILTDGASFLLLPEAKDYKRIGEGDKGPNTGGMGAISPVAFADEAFIEKVRKRIILPTIEGLKTENIIYKGFIFLGLIQVEGDPYVIEYNCRMGDPETEVVMPRFKNDLIETLIAMDENRLHEVTLETDPRAACTVMLVSEGYPEKYEKGKVISGLSDVGDSLVFQAGTVMKDSELQTNGGRVLAITSLATTLEESCEKSYRIAEKIQFEGRYFRRDIGFEFLSK